MIFEHYSKNKKILLAVFVVIVLIGAGILVWQEFFEEKECTTDVKVCPDGSYIGRTGPDCEFAACPEGDSVMSSNFQSKELENGIVRYLLTQNTFSWNTTEGSHHFCGIENLRPGNELFPVYIWVYCAEYGFKNGQLETLSGTSLPAKIDYPNELSYYDLGRFLHEIPRDGSLNDDDIKRIFPADAQKLISSLDKRQIIKRVETRAFADILAWEAIKQAFNDCQVKEVFQAHSLDVSVELKNGQQIKTVEPRIDDIMGLASGVWNKCGRINIATE